MFVERQGLAIECGFRHVAQRETVQSEVDNFQDQDCLSREQSFPLGQRTLLRAFG